MKNTASGLLSIVRSASPVMSDSFLSRYHSAFESVRKNGSAIKFVEVDILSTDICLAAVKKSGVAIRYIPLNYQTDEVCMAAVKQNGHAIQYIYDSHRTPEICVAALEKTPNAVQYLNDHQFTKEVCELIAVDDFHYDKKGRELSRTLAHMDTALDKLGFKSKSIDPESSIVTAADITQGDGNSGNARKQLEALALAAASILNKDDISEHFLLNEVKENARTIYLLKAKEKTYDVCLTAVRKNSYMIQYASDENRSPYLCRIAVSKQGRAVKWLKPEQRSPSICECAVMQSGHAIQYLTAAQRTPFVCLLAVQQNATAIKYLSDAQLSKDVCEHMKFIGDVNPKISFYYQKAMYFLNKHIEAESTSDRQVAHMAE